MWARRPGINRCSTARPGLAPFAPPRPGAAENSTRPFLSAQGADLVNFYNGAGFAASLMGGASSIMAADLAGVDLFIAYAPDDGFSASEVAALQAFLAAGHNVLVTAENNNFPDLIDLVNVLLSDLGSSMSVVSGLDAAGYQNATLQGPSPYLAGTAGLRYGASSTVTGGLGLLGTVDGNVTFLAVDNVGTVAEPATLALALLGALGSLTSARRASRTGRQR